MSLFGQTSTWGQQNQQQQQQPQQPSAFGQPSGFGNTGSAFGSTSAFGQPQQTNSIFGSSTTPTTTTASGFGAFSNNNAPSGTSAFGTVKPAAGFGAFGGNSGGTPAFGGGGSTFGGSSTATTTGTFGQPNTTGTSTFGTNNNSLFGKPATFGSTPTTDQPPAPVTTGSANPSYAVYQEKDPASTSNTMLQYQSITAMPAYRGSSFEELRFQDYSQNRKTAQASSAFGSTGFGAPAAQPTPSTGGGLFGQSSQPTNSIFGGGTTGGTAFGTTPSTTTQPPTGFGTFGQNNTNTNTGGSLFGGGGGGTFSQPNQQQQQQQQQQPQQQPSTGFGAFGQPQTQQPTQPATGGGLFGGAGFGQTQPQADNKPATGFGAFGSTNTGSTFGGTGTFGSNTQNTQNTGGLFGKPAQPTTGFGAFGQSAAPKPAGGLFGQPATQPSTTGFGSFGQPATNQQQQPGQPQQQTTGLFGGGNTTGGLFGNTNNNNNTSNLITGATQPAQPTGLFGSTPNQSNPLFGGGGATGGLFGNTQNNTAATAGQPQTTGFGGLFGGQKPATTPGPTGGLFGNTILGQSTTTTTQPQGGLFGNTMAQPQPQPQANAFGGGSLFGNKSTLGTSALQPAAPGALTASIAQPIGSNLPIFSMLPAGPRAVTLEPQQAKKKPDYLDPPSRNLLPMSYNGSAPSKLRGFGKASVSSRSLKLNEGAPGVLLLSQNGDKNLNPLARSLSPALGSNSRQSVKKLILDKKVDPADIFGRSTSPGASTVPAPKVTFNPALSVAHREREATAHANGPKTLSTSAPALDKHNRFTAHSTHHVIEPHERSAPSKSSPIDGEELEEGDYWVKPSLQVLKNTGYEDLAAFNGLVVGRVGFGEIHFLEPVDLTGLPRLSALLGQLVRFDDKEVTVYPDTDEVDKPPPGSGLNVKARVILIRCWPVDKANREPIKDEKHPTAIKHIKRLRNMKETHFESFDLEEGKWIFSVDHF